MYSLFKVIEPIVRLPIYKRKFNKQYSKVINKFIDDMIAKGVKESEACNDWAISEIVSLLDELNLEEKYDESKGAWSTFVIMNLYFMILKRYRTFNRMIHKQRKIKEMYGEVNMEVGYGITKDEDGKITEKEYESGEVPVDERIYGKEFLDIIENYYGSNIYSMRVAGMSPSAIAQELNKPVGTVTTYLYRKRLGLLKHLEKNGYSCNDLPNTVINKLGGK